MNTSSLVSPLVLLTAMAAPLAVIAAEIPSPDVQIAGAVLAAPEDQRDRAGVLGFPAAANEGGDTLVLLRAGTGELLCLADDPGREGFNVACYHRSLEPFMARGRVLRREGVQGLERTSRRWQEIEAGALSMPDRPTTLHILEGDSFDPGSGEVANPYRRWTIYIPGATTESTGLATTPSDSAPWLMMPGTPSAHIMITPPRPKKPSGP